MSVVRVYMNSPEGADGDAEPGGMPAAAHRDCFPKLNLSFGIISGFFSFCRQTSNMHLTLL